LAFVLLAAATAQAAEIDLERIVSIESLIGDQLQYPTTPRDKNMPILPMIIGGHDTKIEEHPHHVGVILTIGDAHGLCGGSLIANNIVMTAAHCVDPLRNATGNFTIVAGINELKEINGTKHYKVKAQSIHPEYTGEIPKTGLPDDIALLLLEEEVEDSDRSRPIKINRGAKPEPGSKVTLSGHGRFHWYNNDLPAHIQETTMDVVKGDVCRQWFKDVPHDDARQLCVHSWTHSACQGDSGGALQQCEVDEESGDKECVAVGIVSFGFGLSCAPFPGIYTDVDFFADWIDDESKKLLDGDY